MEPGRRHRARRPPCRRASRNTGTRSTRGPRDAADVERVAHLAVERVDDARREPVGVGALAGDEPRAAGAVQAHGRSPTGGRPRRAGRRRAPSRGRRRAPRRAGRTAPSRRRAPSSATSVIVPGGQPGRRERRLDGVRRRSPRRCPARREPMRITTVLPVRTTPAASANTLGRPSNTKRDDAERRPAGLDRPPVVVDRGRSGRRDAAASRASRAGRRSCRRASTRVSTSRVVERPAARRRGDVGVVRGEHRRPSPSSSASRAAKRVEERRDLVVADTPPSAANAVDGRRRPRVGDVVLRLRDVQQVAGRRRRRSGGRRARTPRPARRRP